MKFAILSDIHGNIWGLEECFKYIDNIEIDGIIWCGDYITDIPMAHEVIEFIRNSMKKYKKTYIVKGNREEYISEYHKSSNKFWKMENRNGPFLYTYNQLSNDDIEFILNLPETCVVDIPNTPKICVSHYKETVFESDCQYHIFGHSHYQEIIEKDKITYINSGSVGLPIEGNICAHFSVLDINENYSKVEMYGVKYDVNKVIECIQLSGLDKTIIKWNDVLIKTFKTGKNYALSYVMEVFRIAKERKLGDNLDNIPICIWDEARKNVGI